MGFDFAVLGATGMQGRIVTRDLLENGYSVLLCGRDKSQVIHILNKYKKKTSFEFVELENISHVTKVIKNSGAKIVINCVEGDYDLSALKACIEAGVHSIDLGSDIGMTKKQFALNRVLKEKKLIHITGVGSVPGIGNVMLNYADGKFDKIDTVEVGFAWDSNIKKFVVPFSMESILEEFTFNAPYMKNYQMVRVKPSDSIVRTYHKNVGRENEFICGHHPETYTFRKFCSKKGLKNFKFIAGFPDHSMQVIQTLVDLGFASSKPVKINGMDIRADKFVTALLKRLPRPKGYTETENLWVLIKGKNNGYPREILMECLVHTLKGWEDAGSNIDTGMPASIAGQMIFKKQITKPGSYSPEFIIPPHPFFKELRRRHIDILENGKKIN